MNGASWKPLRVLEEFVSIQGTGHLVGQPQYFVRLAGCSVMSCPIRQECDEPDALSRHLGQSEDAGEVALRAVREMGRGGWLHITGGEPFDQKEAVTQLGIDARRMGLRVHYQTSGAREVGVPYDWLTVSPKVAPGDLKVTTGSELVLLDTQVTIEEIRSMYRMTRFLHYFLQPVHGRDRRATIDKLLLADRCGLPWRFTDQMHKTWEVR